MSSVYKTHRAIEEYQNMLQDKYNAHVTNIDIYMWNSHVGSTVVF